MIDFLFISFQYMLKIRDWTPLPGQVGAGRGKT
jgi:hypothetical protein